MYLVVILALIYISASWTQTVSVSLYCLLLLLSAIASNAVHANCIIMTNFVKQFLGRKRESTVWTYFEEQANIRKSKCLVPDVKGRIKCGHLVAGKNATNLKAHLLVHHSDQFKDLMFPKPIYYGFRY